LHLRTSLEGCNIVPHTPTPPSHPTPSPSPPLRGGEGRKRLIVTADDFGASPPVNEAIERAHREGVLTCTSLMVGAPAAADAVARAKATPTLKVGLHVVLVDGTPVLPPSEVPDLVDGRGQFRDDMAVQGARIFFLPGVRRQIAQEIEAQFRVFAATGLTLDHVDAHRHFHMHPTIGALIARIGKHFGARAGRVPQEPASVLRQVEPANARMRVLPLLTPFLALLRSRFHGQGMATNDRVFGLSWTGAMTEDRVLALIERLPDGVSEIYCHPATTDAIPGAVPGYQYAAEFAALISPRVKAAIGAHGIELTSFSAL
jgi:chitin disaccharide deacetylase